MKRMPIGAALYLGILVTLAQSVCAQRSPLAPANLAEQYLLAAANQERISRGLPALRRDAQLARAAAQHALAMAAHQTISHQFAGEAELTDRGASAGARFSVIAENVGEAPNVVTIHDMWMRSQHHRENLLEPAVDSVGISVMNRGGELFAVEDFARTVRTVSLEEQESSIAALMEQQGRVALASGSDQISAARHTCSMSTGYAGAELPGFVMRFTSDSLTQLPDQLKTRLASGRYHEAAIGACAGSKRSAFTSYNFAVLLYP